MIQIKQIKLVNFRCYDEAIFNFKKGINVIVGNNAVGKTSLVEAIGMSGLIKSHKTYDDKELITFDKDYYFIQLTIERDEDLKDDVITIFNSADGKKIAKNDKYFKTMSLFIGEVKIVLFYPDDSKLIIGEPRAKRKFLDVNIGQIDKEYFNSLSKYNKILKERNELLKTFRNIKEERALIDVYNCVLIKEGSIIINKRNDFINKLNDSFNSKVITMSSKKECGKIVYKPYVNVDNFEKLLKERLTIDITNKTTSCGPHKDDFFVLLNEFKASDFASQGQQKTLALCIKLSLVDIIKEIDENVIIILDDVFGELDKERQNDLFKLINSSDQIFITTNSIALLNDDVVSKSNIINIKQVGESNGK